MISNDLDAVTDEDAKAQVLPYHLNVKEARRIGLVLCEECLQLLADREEAGKPDIHGQPRR